MQPLPPPPQPPAPMPPPPPPPVDVQLLHDRLLEHGTTGMLAVRCNIDMFYNSCPETRSWVPEEATWAKVAHMNAVTIIPGMELEGPEMLHTPAHVPPFPPDCRNAYAVHAWLGYVGAPRPSVGVWHQHGGTSGRTYGPTASASAHHGAAPGDVTCNCVTGITGRHSNHSSAATGTYTCSRGGCPSSTSAFSGTD